ncbi:MAG: rod shape-determining protein RodA [Elusimicrobiota bacterium]
MNIRNLKHIDWKLVGITLIIMVYGYLIAYSAIYNMKIINNLAETQLIAIVLGIVLMAIFSFINYQIYYQHGIIIYAIAMILLILVLMFGKSMRGARSWFDLGFVHFQPAELARIAIVIVLAAYLDKRSRVIERLSVVREALIMTGALVVLVLLQPDFGSSLVFIVIVFGMMYVAGVPRLYLSGLALYGIISIGIPLYITYMKMRYPAEHAFNHPALLIFGTIIVCWGIYMLANRWRFGVPFKLLLYTYIIIVLGLISSFGIMHILKDYQRKRLVTFLNPELDPLGAGYNVIQSKVAVGSGGLIGKGLFSGTQGQLGFLPERHTDFIFSVVAEETGFLGAVFLVLLFIALLWRMYIIAQGARDRFGSFIVSGFLVMFSFYCVMNLGVVMGLMPVTGLPLPLVSYGGSSMIMTCISFGIILNVGMKRYSN